MPWSGPICRSSPPGWIKKATDVTDWVKAWLRVISKWERANPGPRHRPGPLDREEGDPSPPRGPAQQEVKLDRRGLVAAEHRFIRGREMDDHRTPSNTRRKGKRPARRSPRP